MFNFLFKILGGFGKQTKALKNEFLEQLLKLVTSGFGLVAALAWNELIKEVIEQYVKPIAGEASQLVSLLIYAVIVTVLAVTVTYSLTKLSKKN